MNENDWLKKTAEMVDRFMTVVETRTNGTAAVIAQAVEERQACLDRAAELSRWLKIQAER